MSLEIISSDLKVKSLDSIFSFSRTLRGILEKKQLLIFKHLKTGKLVYRFHLSDISISCKSKTSFIVQSNEISLLVRAQDQFKRDHWMNAMSVN